MKAEGPFTGEHYWEGRRNPWSDGSAAPTGLDSEYVPRSRGSAASGSTPGWHRGAPAGPMMNILLIIVALAEEVGDLIASRILDFKRPLQTQVGQDARYVGDVDQWI